MKQMLSNEELSGLSLELSLLLHAGVGTGDALFLLAEEGGCRELLSGMARAVDAGAPLSAALRESGVIPGYACGLVEAGERTGRTEEALSALSRYYEDRGRLARRVRDAVLYPAVMFGLVLVVVGVLLVKVLPIFDDVYASLGGRLTGVAGRLLGLGRWLDGALPVLWVLLAAAAALAALAALSRPLRNALLARWRSLFGDRGVARKLNDARLAQGLAIGLSGGLPMEEAAALAEGLLEGNAQARCAGFRARLGRGEGLGASLRSSGLLPARQCRLLELGVRSGAGDRAMEKIARDLTDEGEAALDRLTGRVEPALVLTCSVLVGLILLSVMLPLMNIMSAIG